MLSRSPTAEMIGAFSRATRRSSSSVKCCSAASVSWRMLRRIRSAWSGSSSSMSTPIDFSQLAWARLPDRRSSLAASAASSPFGRANGNIAATYTASSSRPAASSRRASSITIAPPTPQCPYSTSGPWTRSRITWTHRSASSSNGRASSSRPTSWAGMAIDHSECPAGRAWASGW